MFWRSPACPAESGPNSSCLRFSVAMVFAPFQLRCSAASKGKRIACHLLTFHQLLTEGRMRSFKVHAAELEAPGGMIAGHESTFASSCTCPVRALGHLVFCKTSNLFAVHPTSRGYLEAGVDRGKAA